MSSCENVEEFYEGGSITEIRKKEPIEYIEKKGSSKDDRQ